ncbi:deoxyguanosinetriphosphate triphosphohydrolase [Rhodovibrionaceae bacterium A322]
MAADKRIRASEPLAPYATQAAQSRGRLVHEPESATRTVFQRDRDRIVHSGAFRKLQYKTQVFVYHEGDYFRTRLTHSLEVAQIARSISRDLRLDEDLAEALALAHDLGHTCFGHAGEHELQDAMKDLGGFDHNEQTFRTVTLLEGRYADFDGLNLTWESLEGLAKHNGPVRKLRRSFADFNAKMDLELGSFAGLEAQVAALSDDIAYNNHDIDDGLRAELIQLEEIMELPFVGSVFKEVSDLYPGLDQGRLIHEAIRRLISIMVEDVVAETSRRLKDLQPDSADDIRRAGRATVAFSDTMVQNQKTLRRFLFQRVYRHYKVNRMSFKVRRVVKDLFHVFLDQPNCLPNQWRAKVELAKGQEAKARVVADYIAGMTDRYALEAHEKFFDPYVRI